MSFLLEVVGVMAKHWASGPGMVSLLIGASVTLYWYWVSPEINLVLLECMYILNVLLINVRTVVVPEIKQHTYITGIMYVSTKCMYVCLCNAEASMQRKM